MDGRGEAEALYRDLKRGSEGRPVAAGVRSLRDAIVLLFGPRAV